MEDCLGRKLLSIYLFVKGSGIVKKAFGGGGRILEESAGDYFV